MSVFRAERRKLLAQLSTRVLALACALGPLAFAVVLSVQSGAPADTLLGVYVHSSGYAVSFVVLGFADYLGFAVVAGVVAGDMFSSEDRYGTWKTVLTRSRSRKDVFAGKVLAAAALSVAMVALVALSSLVAGLVVTGDQPLVGLSGTILGSGELLWLALASWALSIPPVLAFVSLAVLFSTATRNGIVGVLGPLVVALIMQLLALIGSGNWMHMLLVASAFESWHGLLTAPKFYGPLIIGTGVCAVWVVACLGISWRLLRRRDIAGPSAGRRAGWAVPVRVTVASAALVVALGAAGNLGPAGITRARLEPSIAQAFEGLTILQQKELGRTVPEGAKLQLSTNCNRRSGVSQGPGDDWVCAINLVTPPEASEPFALKTASYDVSVKSDGCYKAEAPPSFIGQQMMTDEHGHSIVNPLFTIYGCFDPTAPAPPCTGNLSCASSRSGASSAPHAKTPGSHAPTGTSAAPVPNKAERSNEERQLHEAERRAGPRVMKGIEEAQKRQEQEAARAGKGEAAPLKSGG